MLFKNILTMKYFIKILFFILVPYFAFSQSLGKKAGKTRISPTTELRKGTKPNQILMTRQSDTSLVYSDLDTILKPTKYLSLIDTTCTSWNGGYAYMCQDGVGATLTNIVINGNTYTLNQPLYDGSGNPLPNYTALNTAVQNAISSAGYSATVSGFDDGGCYYIEFNLISGCSSLVIDFNYFNGANNQTTQGSSTPNATITQVDINTLIDTAIANCPSLTIAKLNSCNVSYLYMFNCSTGAWELFKTPNIYTAGKTLFVDEVTGNDATAKKGCPTCAFKTIDAALQMIEEGDLLKVMPGNYSSNLSIAKTFNIYCENGVNWELKNKLLITNAGKRFNKMSWRFDRLYSNSFISNAGGDTITQIEIFANEIENILIGGGGNNEVINISRCIGCMTGAESKLPNTQSTININNLTSTTNGSIFNYNSFGIDAPNSSTSINVNNLNVTHSSSSWGGVFNFDYGSGGRRLYNLHISNANYYPQSQYLSAPVQFSDIAAWGLGGENTLIYLGEALRDSSIVNVNLENYKGIGHGVHINSYNARDNQTLYINIKGIFQKGVPVSLTQIYQNSSNYKIIIDLDVECFDGAGILLGMGYMDLHNTNRIIIRGRIKTHNYSCIEINGTTSTNIILENLTMVNLGGINSIVSASPTNIIVKPGCSSNVATSANVTQLGTGIYVDPNFNN